MFHLLLPSRSDKLAPYGTADRLLVRGKIRLTKVEHPKFDGHVTPNWNEYHFRYWLGVSQFTDGGVRLWNRPFSQLSALRDLDLDLGSRSYGIPSCITHRPCLHTKCRWNRKKLFVDGRTALLGVDLMTDISKGANRVKIVYGMAEKNSTQPTTSVRYMLSGSCPLVMQRRLSYAQFMYSTCCWENTTTLCSEKKHPLTFFFHISKISV